MRAASPLNRAQRFAPLVLPHSCSLGVSHDILILKATLVMVADGNERFLHRHAGGGCLTRIMIFHGRRLRVLLYIFILGLFVGGDSAIALGLY